MSDTASEPLDPDQIDTNDDQYGAEEFDEDNLEPDVDADDWGPDHGLAVREASVVTDTGDVPADSLEERMWREEPDRLRPDTRGFNEELIEPHPDFGLDADFASESRAGFAHEIADGIAVGDMAGPLDTVLPAEEAAMHVVGDPDEE